MKAIYLILLSILFVASGQLMLKQGLTELGTLDFSLAQLSGTIALIFTKPLVLLGLSLFASSSLLWLTALSRAELSFAYPLMSISYATVAVTSFLIFHETINWTRILGIAIILIGISILALDGRKNEQPTP